MFPPRLSHPNGAYAEGGSMWIQTPRTAGLVTTLSGLLIAGAFAVAFPTVVTGSNVVLVLIFVLGLAWVAKNTYDEAQPSETVAEILHEAEVTPGVPIEGSKAHLAGTHASA